jgi:type II secretory pathway pseudopilin PulG
MKITLKNVIRKLGEQAGIGLVETLVAIAILGVVANSFVSSLSAGSIAVRIQNESTLAQELARSQMEAIKAAPYDKSGRSYQAVDTPEGYGLAIDIGPAVDEKGNDKKTIQKVTVTVKHNEEAIITLEDFKVNR